MGFIFAPLTLGAFPGNKSARLRCNYSQRTIPYCLFLDFPCEIFVPFLIRRERCDKAVFQGLHAQTLA